MQQPTRRDADEITAASRRLTRLPALVDADPGLVRRGRFLSADVHLGVGSSGHLLAIREGRIADLAPATGLMRSWTFSIRAEPADWLAHWADPPAPGWHDLLAMKKRGLTTIEGDLAPFLRNLQYVKDVLALPRHDRQS